uniref:Uncharacterized protein n=1 Tax=Arundo donax TaxID=35708 RepID=A0A0A8Z5I7_ARUDO
MSGQCSSSITISFFVDFHVFLVWM